MNYLSKAQQIAALNATIPIKTHPDGRKERGKKGPHYENPQYGFGSEFMFKSERGVVRFYKINHATTCAVYVGNVAPRAQVMPVRIKRPLFAWVRIR